LTENGDGSMPIYEYRCKECATDFEDLIRNAADEEALRCPECGSPDCTRQMSTFGLAGSVRKPITAGASSCAGCTASSCAGCR
jgi:putative FmdB family regulatory protein